MTARRATETPWGDDYEGGDLVCHCGNVNMVASDKPAPNIEKYTVPATAGTIAVWPSWVVHEVRPLTAGFRWALVLSMIGPRPFR
jgi:predicted 2-oxoglutarate/Fe(II)-dependent dioxygenase YbiX